MPNRTGVLRLTVTIHAALILATTGLVDAEAAGRLRVDSERDAPVFSFWGHLPLRDSARSAIAFDDTMDTYDEPLPQVPDDVAATCCAVRPGQPVALVRRGRVLGGGEVGAIRAAMVASASSDRMLLFDVVGIPDSLGAADGRPMYPDVSDRDYDLYVVGRHAVAELEPARRTWVVADDLTRIVEQALAAKAFEQPWLRAVVGDAYDRHVLPEPGPVVDALRSDTEFLRHEVLRRDGGTTTVETMTHPRGRAALGFARVTGMRLTGPVFVRGLVDFFLEVDGESYMVMRHSSMNTGVWSYMVYRLDRDHGPQLVHADGAWST